MRTLVIGMLLALAAAPGILANAPEFDVCESGCAFDSIQAAVDAAPDGATIRVAPGFYRGYVILDHNVTLLGAQAGVPAYGRAGPESVIEGIGRLSSANMAVLVQEGTTLDGFVVQHSDPWNDRLPVWVISMGPAPARVLNVVARDGTVGMDVAGNGPAEIAGNYLENNEWDPGAYPEYEPGFAMLVNMHHGADIHDNVFAPHSRLAIQARGAIGIDITRNLVLGGGGFQADAPTYHVNIRDNELRNIEGPGIVLQGQTWFANIEHNTLDRVNGNGIQLDQRLDVKYKSGEIRVGHNQLDNIRGFGLVNRLSMNEEQVVDARDNWWGSPFGPRAGELLAPAGLGNAANGSGVDASRWCATRDCSATLG